MFCIRESFALHQDDRKSDAFVSASGNPLIWVRVLKNPMFYVKALENPLLYVNPMLYVRVLANLMLYVSASGNPLFCSSSFHCSCVLFT